MNIYVMYCSLFVSLIAFFWFAVLAYQRKDIIGKNLGRAIKCAFAIIVCYIAIFFFHNPMVTNNLTSLIKILIVWILYFAVGFVEAYTNTLEKKWKKWGILSAIFLDSLLFITNPVNRLVMTSELKIVDDEVFISLTPQFYYPFHLAIVMVLGIYTMVILIRKARISSEYVKFRYTLLIHFAILIYILETWFMLDDRLPIDYTVFLYVFVIFLGYFLSYSYVPRKLLRAIVSEVEDNIADATIIYDEKGDVIRSNATADKLIEESHRKSLNDLSDYLGDVSDGQREIEIEGKIISLQIRRLKDKKENIISTIFIFRDITESKKIDEHRHMIATTDYLTKALNRSGFFEKANELLAESSEETTYILLVGGIEDFKEINSIFGTQAGDELLLEIASKMAHFANKIPMVFGRTAEGKFSCLVSTEDVDEVKETLITYELNINSDTTMTAALNFGMIEITDRSQSLDYYYERALLALAEAKKDKSVNFVEYTHEMEDVVARKQLMTASMHNSLKEGDFFVVLQPQISLTDKKVVGAEALVRWNHPTLGIVSPADFIPLFEGNGFITKLDQYIWRKSAQTAVELKQQGIFDGTISVNVSQVDITSINVPETFEKIVEETGIEKERLHIEITESACANNTDILIDTIVRLREKGFTLEIDDFGSGYSSLNVLKNLPFDTIKLDMEFMRNEEKTPRGEIIIDSIARMIHSMEGRIIVEGIENLDNYDRSIRLGGDVGQGYLFARPLIISDFCTFVTEHNKVINE